MEPSHAGTAGPISIQRMETYDLEDVVALCVFPFVSPWSKRMFIEEMENPFGFCFVAKRNDGSGEQMAGFICFRIIGDESELLNLCVRPENRRRAIGKELMRFYFDFSTERLVRAFYLEVNGSNEPAIHLYSRFSYRPVGKRKRFYDGQIDAVVMRREA